MEIAAQYTRNGTRVLDPLADAAPMVVVYRGLGPEYDKSYSWDTADWMVDQTKKAMPKELRNKIILVVPDSYTKDSEECLQQAKQLIGKISFYSLCGFSKGGGSVYRNMSRRTWQILGPIDPVSPTMEGFHDDDLDRFASKIRCVYRVKSWGPPPPKDRPPKDCTKHDKSYAKIKTFYDHLKDLKVEMVDGPEDQGHQEMPRLFFETYGSSFL